jgi:hypothetical protein
MSFVRVWAFLDPFNTFLKQLATGDVYTNEKGQVLFDLPGELTIDDAVKKGEPPLLAVPNIRSILIAYRQVAQLGGNDALVQSIRDKVSEFERRILKPLELDSPIQESSLKIGFDLVKDMQAFFLKAPLNDVMTVNQALISLVKLSEQFNVAVSLDCWVQPFLDAMKENPKRIINSLNEIIDLESIIKESPSFE